MYERLEKLKHKANYYNTEICSLKKLIEDYIPKGKNPLNIEEWQSYSPCTGFHEEEQECDLPYYQKYYAYLLYFRKLLKLVEKEIRKEERKILNIQRANPLTIIKKDGKKIFKGTKRQCYDFFKKEAGEGYARNYWRRNRKHIDVYENRKLIATYDFEKEKIVNAHSM